MATQSSNIVVKIEPVIAGPAIDLGPTDSVAANAVLLTRENLRTVGSYPPRVARDWKCILWLYETIAGVETIIAIDTWAIDGTYWDPITRVAVDLPIALTSTAGQIAITLPDAPAIAAVAGMYEFAIKGTAAADPDFSFDVCSGKIEFLPAIPS